MEDLNVKIKPPIPVASTTPAGKDSAATPATTLAQAFSQAFNQFLNKGAAKAHRASPLALPPTATVSPAVRDNYAPPPPARPLPTRADDSARVEHAPAPAAKPADDRPAPTQSTRREDADSNTGNSAKAQTASAPSNDDDAEVRAGDASVADNAKNTDAPKAAAAHLHAKAAAEKLVEGENHGRKVARAAKTRTDDDRSPTDVAQNVLVALAADPRPVAAKNDETRNDSAENAETVDTDQHRTDGIANALARLVRNRARQENVRNGENTQSSERNTETHGDDDKAAKSAAAATDTRGRQAADLAKRVGPNERLAIDVTVADDAKTLVSRPAATLAATSTHAEGGKSASAQDLHATTAAAQTNANPLAAQAAPAAIAQTAIGPQAAILKAGTEGEIGATSAVQNTANTFGQAQGAAVGSATANTQSAAQTSAANAAQTAQRPAASFRAEILEQISVNIQKAVKDGTDKISIQLRPAELGRVDVRIEVGADGRAQVHVTADRPDTLDLLQRDARDLARALQDAGLRADAGNLQFSLREQASDQRQARARSNGGAQGIDAVNAADAETAGIMPAWTPTAQPGRVDIRA